MRISKYFLALWICLITTPILAVSVGQPIDSFRLRDLNGTFHTDTDYQGKVLILAVIGYN